MMELDALYKEERRLLKLLVQADSILDQEYEEDLKREIRRLNEIMAFLENDNEVH